MKAVREGGRKEVSHRGHGVPQPSSYLSLGSQSAQRESRKRLRALCTLTPWPLCETFSHPPSPKQIMNNPGKGAIVSFRGGQAPRSRVFRPYRAAGSKHIPHLPPRPLPAPGTVAAVYDRRLEFVHLARQGHANCNHPRAPARPLLNQEGNFTGGLPTSDEEGRRPWRRAVSTGNVETPGGAL